MTPTVLSSGVNDIRSILTELNEQGGFNISILTDVQGLPIASASRDGVDPEQHSANVAIMQKSISQLVNRLGMKETDEISIFDSAGQRLVCRPIQVNSHNLILAVIVPDKRKAYRKVLNHSVSQIRRVWSQYWS
jgi:predicted regulator of Ras-like GTPase activity (Roadblock/LC7/MglB family)